ncbi:MAG: hypothetical protein KAT46_02150 [Deltaproteobacteria bacterium]|nr:hypothetical protein [Deltaproteobacteria bacterium]
MKKDGVWSRAFRHCQARLISYGSGLAFWLIGGLALVLAVSIFLYIALGKIEVEMSENLKEVLHADLDATETALHNWYHDRVEDMGHLVERPDFLVVTKSLLLLHSKGQVIRGSKELKVARKLIQPFVDDHADLGFFIIAPDYVNVGSMRDENMDDINVMSSRGNYLKKIFKGETRLVLPFRSEVALPKESGGLGDELPTMFLGTPIRDEEGKVIAVFTFRLNPMTSLMHQVHISHNDTENSYMSDDFFFGRTGRSGEVYAFDKEGTILTESRFKDELVNLDLIEAGQSAALNLKLLDPGGDLTRGFTPDVSRKKLPFTKPIESATGGNKGVDVKGYRDYRGVEVVGAWLWDTELDMGVVVEMDKWEAYKNYFMIRRVLVFVVITMFLIFSIYFFVIVRHSRTIERVNERLEIEAKERIHAENQLFSEHELLENKAKELIEANEELSQYAYVVSHDLKSPLRAIHNYADFLREDLEDKLEAEQLEYLDGLGKAVLQSEELVGDLLEYSRIGKNNAKFEDIGLENFIKSIGETIGGGSGEGVNLRFTAKLPIVRAEPVLLRQIFTNLLMNALKFNTSDEKVIEVGVVNCDDDVGCEVFVRDNGIGIDAKYHSRIFRVFQRLHTQNEYEGTGVGLAIVKKAAEKCGGSVRVESSPSKGSTFFVTLRKGKKLSEENQEDEKRSDSDGGDE